MNESQATPMTENLPPLPEPAFRLPLPQAAQWQHALIAAEREPFGTVSLDGRTVLAVHDAIRAAVMLERERCAKLCRELASMVDDGAGMTGRLWQAARNIESGEQPLGMYPDRTEPDHPRHEGAAAIREGS